MLSKNVLLVTLLTSAATVLAGPVASSDVSTTLAKFRARDIDFAFDNTAGKKPRDTKSAQDKAVCKLVGISHCCTVYNNKGKQIDFYCQTDDESSTAKTARDNGSADAPKNTTVCKVFGQRECCTVYNKKGKQIDYYCSVGPVERAASEKARDIDSTGSADTAKEKLVCKGDCCYWTRNGVALTTYCLSGADKSAAGKKARSIESSHSAETELCEKYGEQTCCSVFSGPKLVKYSCKTNVNAAVKEARAADTVCGKGITCLTFGDETCCSIYHKCKLIEDGCETGPIGKAKKARDTDAAAKGHNSVTCVEFGEETCCSIHHNGKLMEDYCENGPFEKVSADAKAKAQALD
jgi:hypothetical protein